MVMIYLVDSGKEDRSIYVGLGWGRDNVILKRLVGTMRPQTQKLEAP